jgi:hypothetical protein
MNTLGRSSQPGPPELVMETSVQITCSSPFRVSRPTRTSSGSGLAERFDAQPACPACGAPTLELRGQQRCTRCRLVLCVGCDAEVAVE